MCTVRKYIPTPAKQGKTLFLEKFCHLVVYKNNTVFKVSTHVLNKKHLPLASLCCSNYLENPYPSKCP